jgi:hypothetical protein
VRRGAAHLLRVLTAAALCAAAGLFTTTASAQSPAILSVPYLPQSEALCGGASAAMVMRYWGDRDVYADAFAPLVDKSAGGIHTSALVNELERRQWTVVAGAGDLSQLTQEIGRGRPVIALIEDRPGRFHYVVVVSTRQDRILFHDPARAPSRAADPKMFDAKWARAGRWMAIVLPAQNPASRSATSAAPVADVNASPSSSSPEPCANEVARGLDLAGRGEKERARRAFEEASVTCPASAAPWRELAGLDAVETKWDAAAEHARRAVAIDPADAHAWRVLATAEYLLHHDLEALAAWNRVGEPRTDLVDISGLGHTRYMAIADAVGVRPKELLTPGALRLAQRRVRDVPAIAAARVAFRPAENGRAQIDVSVVERDRVPATYASWAGIGIGAVTERQLAASFANVTGGGDVVTASWRWWTHRPMIAASYAAPAPRALGGGVWRLDASRETQTFGPSAFEETRTRGGFEMSTWISERIRLAGGTAIERFRRHGPGDNVAGNRPRTAVLSGRVEYWPVVDRVALEAGGSTWHGARESFGAFGAAIRGRTTTESTGTVWLANAGYRAVTPSSPASIWPGADTGHARDVLLRAHPLLDDGIITDAVFGRRLSFGGGEVQHWLSPGKWPLRLAPAAFVDIARATRGLQTTIDRAQIDAGVGLRLSVLGMGVMRIDIAHGLRDGRTAFSVGWTNAGR